MAERDKDTPPPPDPREARLSQALRANLKRRKAGQGAAPPSKGESTDGR